MLDILPTLKTLLLPLTEEQLTRQCAPGEWAIKEILVHKSNDERILVNRTLRVARNDPTPLLGFDPDLYAAHSGANKRSIEDILEEVTAVRKATKRPFGSRSDKTTLCIRKARALFSAFRAARIPVWQDASAKWRSSSCVNEQEKIISLSLSDSPYRTQKDEEDARHALHFIDPEKT